MSKSTAEIRQTFLDFFKSKGHQVVDSSSLVPNNDPTLLFTNAGMNQFKDVFLGQDRRDYSRATTSQRCVRAGGKHNDLENVGYTARHHTFFEMLGNFSFGDYFKHDAIGFAWELLTSPQWFNLPKERLWVTIYETDDEAFDIWAKEIGVPAERIIRIGDNKGSPYASDNFWQMGDTGPCGPCSEIFYDHGEHIWGGPPGSLEEDGDRYIEIWNIVFMQFNRQPDGTMLPLPKPSVDTGMGLERISAVLQHVNSNYEIDLFQQLIGSVAKVVGTQDLNNKSLRVIADHIRSCAFLIADGVTPSNEGRGYVLRRIIRRAIRHGNLLGAKQCFFYKLVSPLIDVMDRAGEELRKQQTHVENLLKNEEEQFARTLERGLALLDTELSALQGDTLSGETVFRLYDTFGFPVDLTADICRERGLKINEDEFEQAMDAQRQRAREASGFSVDYHQRIQVTTQSEFDGYDNLAFSAAISEIFVAGHSVDKITAGEQALIVLDRTPFYAEAGGQIGDRGVLRAGENRFQVDDTQKYAKALGHLGSLTQGELRVGQTVEAQVDIDRRTKIRLNHSATHLLHEALRQVLGEHVAQKGSLVTDKYLRFDFSHPVAMKLEELRRVTQIVNQQVRRNLPITTELLDIEEAKAKGAMALFGEKYEQQVRVLTMGDFSIELCGGTHAQRTGDIGLFTILSETGTAAGIRRIEAITGEHALNSLFAVQDQISELSQVVKTNSSNLVEKVKTITDHNRTLERELQQLKDQQAAQQSASLTDQVVEIQGVKLLVSELKHTDPKLLRTMVDELKNQLGSGVIVLATTNDEKVSLIVGVTKDLTNRLKAGELIGQLAPKVGGKGGGRADMAQAGGNNPALLAQALKSVPDLLTEQLK